MMNIFKDIKRILRPNNKKWCEADIQKSANEDFEKFKRQLINIPDITLMVLMESLNGREQRWLRAEAERRKLSVSNIAIVISLISLLVAILGK